MLNDKCFICNKPATTYIDIKTKDDCEYNYVKIHLCKSCYKKLKNKSDEEIKTKYFIN
jgi:hypothetical protein